MAIALLAIAVAILAWWQGGSSAVDAQAENYFQHRYHHRAPLLAEWSEEEAQENLDNFLDNYLDPQGFGDSAGFHAISAFYACRDGNVKKVKEILSSLKRGGLPHPLICKMLEYLVSGGCMSAEEAEAFAKKIGLNCDEASQDGSKPPPNIPGVGGK